MQILHGAVHVFTDRPGLVEKTYIREYAYYEKHKIEGEAFKKDTVIVYPHAVSRFLNLNITQDYAAASFSKKLKRPTLVSAVGVRGGMFDSEAFVMHWGIDGKCVCQGVIVSERGKIVRNEEPDFEKICGQLNTLSSSSHWSNLWNTLSPLEVAGELQREFSLFLGGPGFEDFLRMECTLKQELLFGRIYKGTTEVTMD